MKRIIALACILAAPVAAQIDHRKAYLLQLGAKAGAAQAEANVKVESAEP